MDLVVWLALILLVVVFVGSLLALIVLCFRRRKQIQREQELRERIQFSRLLSDDENAPDTLIELGPMLAENMDNLEWAADAQGPYEHVLAILKLTCEIVKKLSEVNTAKLNPRVGQIISQAKNNVRMHFDELVAYQPSTAADIRVLEARSLTLVTVVWALYAPFTIEGFPEQNTVTEQIVKLYGHVDALRELIPKYVVKRKKKAGDEDGDDEDEEEEGEEGAAAGGAASAAGQQETVIEHSELPSTSSTTSAEDSEVAPADPAAAVAETPASSPLLQKSNGSSPETLVSS